MRDILMVVLVSMALAAEAPAVPDISATPPPFPISSPAVGPPLDLIGVPYDARVVRQASRRLMRHKGLAAAAFRADPASLIASRADLGRFFAYMALAAHGEGNDAWAILYYCQAARADARYLVVEALEPDQDDKFLPGLRGLRLMTLAFFVTQVAKPARVEPSRLPPEAPGQEGQRP